MLGLNPRDLRKAMKRLGIKVEEVQAVRVVIELEGGSRLVVEDPQVMVMRARGQPPMIYVVGEPVEEKPVESGEGGGEGGVEISEEDVALVAEQAGVSLEEARRALEEAGGDIAEAILRLQRGR